MIKLENYDVFIVDGFGTLYDRSYKPLPGAELLLKSIGKQIAISNPKLFALWLSSQDPKSDAARSTVRAILFGGNFVVGADGKWNLFRKSHFKDYHESDRICILTARHFANLTELATEPK